MRIAFSANPVTAGDDVGLDIRTIGPGPQPVDAQWTFSDGTTGDGLPIHHTWTTARTYPVSAVVTFPGGGTKKAFDSLVVKPKPVPKATLSVTTSGGAGSVRSNPAGINCGSACSAQFDVGSTVVLTAVTPGQLDAWGGACSGNAKTCRVTMRAGGEQVSAQFAEVIQDTKLTLNITNGGIVDVDGGDSGTSFQCSRARCVQQYSQIDNIALTPVANVPGRKFVQWQGACAGSGTTCELSMNDDQTATAVWMTCNPCAAPAAQPAAVTAAPAGAARGRPSGGLPDATQPRRTPTRPSRTRRRRR